MGREQRLEAVLRELNDHLSFGDAPSELLDRVDAILAEPAPAQDERDAKRWQKCKTMPKEWWLEAMADAGRKGGRSLDESIDAALSQQAEPECVHEFVPFRPDCTKCGHPYVEPAPAQDEREARHHDVMAVHNVLGAVPCASLYSMAEAVIDAGYTRPAQTEQQPVGWQSIVLHASELADMVLKGDAPQTAQRTARALLSMLAAPIAQTAPQRED